MIDPRMIERRLEQVVAARPSLGGVLMRVVGSTDFHGQGTAFPIADVGPFIMVDDARGISGPDMPPFGRHPHAGLVAISYVAGGGPWHASSSAPGFEELAFGAGDAVVTSAGRGVVHEELTASSGAHELAQWILRLPAAYRDTPASVQVLAPVVRSERVLCLFDATTLAALGLDAAGYRCQPAAGEVIELPISPGQTAGFVYVRSGHALVGGEPLAAGQVGVLGTTGGTLRLGASDDGPADCLVGLAVPLDEPWAKLLGHNGFVVAGDEATAISLLATYAASPSTFGLG